MTAALLLVPGALAAWARSRTQTARRGSTSAAPRPHRRFRSRRRGARTRRRGRPAARTAQTGDAPEAVLGQEPTPTAPEGEQQPSDSEAPAAGEEPAAEGDTLAEDASGAWTAQPAAAAESAAGKPAATSPMSGLSLIALAAAGVGLLAAGLALRRRGGLREGVTSQRGS